MGNAGPTHLETVSRGKIRELAEIHKWWEVLVTLQFVASGYV